MTPSGSFLPRVTIVLRSVPSGVQDITRPLDRLRKNRRPVGTFTAGFRDFGFWVLASLIVYLLPPQQSELTAESSYWRDTTQSDRRRTPALATPRRCARQAPVRAGR